MVRSRTIIILYTAVAVVGSLLYFSFDPEASLIFPPCPFYKLTGLFCPGCGSQRALHDLLHGRIAEAAGHNLLMVMFVPALGFSAIATINNLICRRKIGQRIFQRPWFAWAVLVVVILFWLLRNLPFAPFNRLAP